jgi:TetR/AcrR family tetracycline transcriptional repressor
MPRAQIVAAALELVDADGADDFSLRSLARRLNSSTATLYRHFSGKEDLLVQVAELVLGEVRSHLPDEVDRGSWREELVATADALYLTFEEHPHTASLLGNSVALGQNGLVLRELVLGSLINHGFSPEIASKAYTSIAHYVIGFCGQLGGSDSSAGAEGRSLRKYFAGLDPVRYPATVSSASFLPTSLRDEFRSGLDLLLDGLSLRAHAGSTTA